jgi:hypothetical protein
LKSCQIFLQAAFSLGIALSNLTNWSEDFMRIKAALVLAALAASAAATAMPASAQQPFSYSRNCNASKTNNQIGGAIVGGLLGSVLGSNVAAKGHKHDGTALGAVVGGAIGAGIGNAQTNCNALPPPAGTYNPNYNSGYGQPYPQPSYDPGYSSGYGNDDDRYYQDRSPRYDDYNRGAVYPSGNRDYRRNDGYAGRDCTDAIQTTRLPDGTVIRRPVEACRDAYYGDWQVNRN